MQQNWLIMGPKSKKILTVLGELFLFFLGILLIVLCMFLVWATADRPHSQGSVPEYQRIKIEKYCRDRKIHPDVVEILPNGRMFYDLEGRRCEIK